MSFCAGWQADDDTPVKFLRVEKFQCDKIFTGEKIRVKNFRPLHAWAKKAKILSGRKFPAIRYILISTL